MIKMYEKLFTYCDGVEFYCELPLREAVRKLEENVFKINIFNSIFSDVSDSRLIGKVSLNLVKLFRQRLFLRNIYQPIFYGKFSSIEGKVKLEGSFVMSPFVRIFTSFCFVIFFISSIILLPITIQQFGKNDQLFVVIPMGLTFLSLFSVILNKWLMRGDVEWMSDYIKKILK